MFGQHQTTFGRKPGEQAEKPPPASHTFRATARRNAMLARARDTLSHLPEPGESVHCLQTGYFDLVMIVPLLCDRYGPATTRLATLTYNGRNLTEMCRLIDGKQTPRLTLLASTFFRNNNHDLWAESLTEIRSRGQRIAAGKSHAKVITLDFGTCKLALEGSANLRTNRSLEQFALIRDDGLHDWHATWIDNMVSRYERDERSAEDEV